ncbi:MAG: FkbM family methyltransferase [Candidatus Hydrothermales bacterium]
MNFNLREKILFYISYIFYKLMIIVEVKKPKIKMFIYELVYSFYKIIDYKKNFPYFFNDELIISKFGKFKIRKRTPDAASVSPAYERRDINFLIKKIKENLKKNKKILFIDIGADIGYYSILIGNKFKGKIKIFSFEPVPYNFELLEQNIKINNLTEIIKPFNFALSDSEENLTINYSQTSPGESSIVNIPHGSKKITIKTKRLDEVIKNDIKNFDVIFIKIDVEGFEERVLKGAEKILKINSKEIILLVEDFINPSIKEFLKKSGFKFLCKLTSYNSFWIYKL